MTVSDTSTHANLADSALPGARQRRYRPRLEENAGRLVDQEQGWIGVADACAHFARKAAGGM